MTVHEDAARIMGEEAYKLGKPYMNCPFPDRTEEAKAWKNGWMTARSKDRYK